MYSIPAIHYEISLFFKAAVLQLLKKITVNTRPVMFSEEIYYTDPLIQLTKSLVKRSFSLHNLQRYYRSSRYV